MTATWTAASVEALAPDAASVVAARRLARPGPWSETGRDGRAVWGLCKGSGARPYQTQADLSTPAWKCSCPSRKAPCKHALALLLLYAGGGVPAREPPEWVEEWLEAREKRAATRPAPGEPVRDPEAAARRAAEREARMAAGVDDLRRWLRDAVRGGLGAERLRGWAEWDAFAARLVDAQVPGAASRLRGLGSVAAGRRDDWPARLLEGLGLLHLLCEAHDHAVGPLRDDVRALLGRPVPRDDVLAGEHVQDRWAVLARIAIEQERLNVQRTWLWGTATGRPALLLDFWVGGVGSPLEPRPPAGTLIDAELAFHPSATPLRALPASEFRMLGAAAAPAAGGGVSGALEAAAGALAANPWLDEWPVALAEAVVDGPEPWAVSAVDGSLALGGAEEGLWRLLAFGGGRPVTVFGLWNGAALVPLAAGDEARLVAA